MPSPDPSSIIFKQNADQAYLSLAAILDAIDALVYVTDMDSHEIIFINQYGRKIWGDITGKRCWSSLQTGQMGPCEFCTNSQLVDSAGAPAGVVVWESQNTVDGRWYQCRDQAIPWINGKLARIEIATDITDLKNSVQELKVAKQQAEALSRTDELTGIKNRRALLDEARILFNLARRYGSPLVVAILDMDHFKHINDACGHAAGDRVLIDVAQAVQHNIREVDVFGRLGGEEFVLVLPGLSCGHAIDMLDRLRNAVASLEIATLAFAGQDVADPVRPASVTASIGMAAYEGRYEQFEDLLAAADKALYRAKAEGRNRVVMAPSA